MRLESAIELQKKFLHMLRREIRTHRRQYGISTFGAGADQPQQRVAIGLGRSKKTPSGFRIEVRFQRARGPGWRLAEQFKSLAKGEINIVDTRELIATPPLKARPRRPERVRPLRIGCSIGHVDDFSAGTLGAFVTDQEGEEYLLSCAHVLRKRDSRRRDITQPGPADVDWDITEDDLVADLDIFTEFAGGRLNRADAAAGRLRDGIDHGGNAFPRIGRFTKKLPDLDEFLTSFDGQVRKLGRTTGMTTGRVTAFNVAGVQAYYADYDRAFAFDQVIEVVNPKRAFAKAGDSGSLVVSKQDKVPLGLVFCGHYGNRRTVVYVCRIDHVLKAVRKELMPS